VSDIKKWCDDHRSSALLTYFELDKYSCVEVPRDFEWFCASLPKLHTFWREVLNARKHPEKYIKVKKERAAATTATVGKKAASAASTAASASAATAMAIVIDEHDRATIRHLYEATSHLTNAQLDSLHYLAATATAAAGADDFEAVDDDEQQQQQNTTTTTAAPMCLITDD
jgi:hypothetical protein